MLVNVKMDMPIMQLQPNIKCFEDVGNGLRTVRQETQKQKEMV